MAVEDADLRQRAGLREIELRLHGVLARRRPVEDDAIGVGIAEDAELAAREGFDPVGIRLGHVARRVDLVVGDDQCALAAGDGIGGDALKRSRSNEPR